MFIRKPKQLLIKGVKIYTIANGVILSIFLPKNHFIEVSDTNECFYTISDSFLDLELVEGTNNIYITINEVYLQQRKGESVLNVILPEGQCIVFDELLFGTYDILNDYNIKISLIKDLQMEGKEMYSEKMNGLYLATNDVHLFKQEGNEEKHVVLPKGKIVEVINSKIDEYNIGEQTISNLLFLSKLSEKNNGTIDDYIKTGNIVHVKERGHDFYGTIMLNTSDGDIVLFDQQKSTKIYSLDAVKSSIVEIHTSNILPKDKNNTQTNKLLWKRDRKTQVRLNRELVSSLLDLPEGYKLYID